MKPLPILARPALAVAIAPISMKLATGACRFASRGSLDSPWGIAVAPSGFGLFSGDILIGNFGNGKISAYQPPPIAPGKWVYKGQLRVSTGAIIKIPGLWAIAFGNGGASGPANNLYFISGPNGEKAGYCCTPALSP